LLEQILFIPFLSWIICKDAGLCTIKKLMKLGIEIERDREKAQQKEF
jgi:hypothetical protein